MDSLRSNAQHLINCLNIRHITVSFRDTRRNTMVEVKTNPAAVLYENDDRFKAYADEFVRDCIQVGKQGSLSYSGFNEEVLECMAQEFELDDGALYWFLDDLLEGHAESLVTHHIEWTGFMGDNQITGNMFSLVADDLDDARGKAEVHIKRMIDGGVFHKCHIDGITPARKN